MCKDYEDLPLFMTVREYAEATGMHVGSVRRAIAKNLIPAEKCGGEYASAAPSCSRTRNKPLWAGRNLSVQTSDQTGITLMRGL